jgi:hypothetical protein
VRKPSPHAWHSASALTRVVHLNATPCHGSRDRAATTRHRGALGGCVGPVDCGRSPRLDRGRSTRGPGARQGARARREAQHHDPAGWRHATELRPLRGTGCPCEGRRVLDSPGPSALAASGLPAVSAAVRGGPGRVLRAAGGSHLSTEVPHQTGDETADPDSGLVQQRYVCVSPPRSVEGLIAACADALRLTVGVPIAVSYSGLLCTPSPPNRERGLGLYALTDDASHRVVEAGKCHSLGASSDFLMIKATPDCTYGSPRSTSAACSSSSDRHRRRVDTHLSKPAGPRQDHRPLTGRAHRTTVELEQGDLACHTRGADVTLQPRLRRGARPPSHPLIRHAPGLGDLIPCLTCPRSPTTPSCRMCSGGFPTTLHRWLTTCSG